MHTNRITTKARTVASLTLVAALLGGCGQRMTAPPPRGDTGGRIDPYRSTQADRLSTAANSVDLLEFSDRVGEQIAQRIGSIPEIADSPVRIVIEMGAIDNRTHTRTDDFAMMRRRVFTGLVNSHVSRYADILESPETMDAQRQRFAHDRQPDSDRYNTRDTYLLQGYFGEMVRGEGLQSTYYYEMTLSNLQSRRIVFTEQFTTKQFRR